MNKVAFRFLYRGLKARFRDQRTEIRSLIEALRPGDVAVDVGANKGSYLPSLSKAVSNGVVIAFEPQPALAEYLRHAISAANLGNIVVEGKGISDRAGTLTLAIPGGGATSPGASFESAVRDREACGLVDVPVCTLDEYFCNEKRRIGAIKIDVEGHELSVLRGAASILSAHKPVVVCESETRHMSHGTVESVLGYFRSQGYDGSFVWRSRLFPISEFSSQVHQRIGGDRYWDHKDYCNNFVMRRNP